MNIASKENLWHYNKELRKFASTNRKDMTKAEVCIWKYLLSRKQMMGYQFRRQRPVLNYIVDFMCKELMLIIEVDGITHLWEDIAKKDVIRDHKLKQVDFTILRFTDTEVLKDMNNVSVAISCFIENFELANMKSTPFNTQ